MASLEAAARDWLSDPAWNKLFKNSFDVIEDQINRALVALAAISLAVRFLANLPAGDLLCIVVGVNGSDLNFNQLAGPFHASLAAYASQDSRCHHAVFVNPHPWQVPGFIMYGPVIMMMQALVLIATEKVWMIFPRLSQKLERFYKSVVEEALLGKDPDVAEDFSGGALSMDKVVRERQREEICGALRGSSLFYHMYIVKNIVEIIFGIVFIVVNILWGLQTDDEIGYCNIPIGDQGYARMQCQQKRYDFYITILWAFILLLGGHILTSLISLIWSIKMTGLRRISNIIDSLKTLNDVSTGGLVESKGDDFLFLFDLVDHSCGQPATLRVLSYTAPTFATLCQADNVNIVMTESSIKMTWRPCPLDMLENSRHLSVQKYVVTIFPFSRHHVKTVSGRGEKAQLEAEFQDLTGGKREYVVTISAIIGDAKMKGVTRTTHLPPFPPHNLNFVSMDDDHHESDGATIKIRWSRPKGEFEKYILKITEFDRSRKTSSYNPQHTWNGRQLTLPSYFPHTANINRHSSFKHYRREREPDEVWLGSDEVEYVKTNMKHGEKYYLELRSMTGNQTCIEDKVPRLSFITKPLPPSLDTFLVTSFPDKILVQWDKPEGPGHSFLDEYKVQLKSSEGKCLKEITVPLKQTMVEIKNIIVSGTEYTVSVASLCRDHGDSPDNGDLINCHYQEVVSNFIDKKVVTPPLPPANLKLDTAGSQPTSLKVKWDPPSYIPTKGKLVYNVSITNLKIGESMKEKAKEVESTVYQFSQLPESGEKYRICVKSVYYPTSGGKPTVSDNIKEIFATKPLPPEKLVVVDDVNQKFSWHKSPTLSVKHYKLKIKRDNEKSTDYWIEDTDDRSEEKTIADIEYELPFALEPEVEYKVNIYSEVESGEGWMESEPLFRLVTRTESMAITADTDVDIPDEPSINMTDGPKTTKILVHRKQSFAAPSRGPLLPEDMIMRENRDGMWSRQTSVNSNI